MKWFDIVVGILICCLAFGFIYGMAFLLKKHSESFNMKVVDESVVAEVQEIKANGGLRQVFVYDNQVFDLYEWSKAYVPCRKIEFKAMKNGWGKYGFEIKKYVRDEEIK